MAGLDTKRTAEVRLQGWEEFDEPVDRIVSIGAFEAFKAERYPLFFEQAYDILPADGRMLLHTILAHTQKFFRDNGIKLTISRPEVHAVHRYRDLPRWAAARRRGHRGSSPPGRASRWSAPTCSGRTTPAPSTCGRPTWKPSSDEAIALTSPEVYERYMHYLTGCADFFRRGITNVGQFTLVKG